MLWIITLLCVPLCTNAVKFLLISGLSECVTQDVPQDVSQVSGGIQVTSLREGSDPAVVVNIYDPQGNVAWAHTVKHEVEFLFMATVKGQYRICFKNQRWSVNVELVYIDFDRRMFTEERSIKRPTGLADDRTEAASSRDTVQVQRSLVQLAEKLDVLVGEQRMIRHRYEWQLHHARRMQSRTLWCALLEVGVLVGAAALQVLIIRQMFSDPSLSRRGAGNRIIKGLMGGGAPGLPTAARRSKLERLA